jgi:membrane protease YdiL (CAAX protease family)
MMIVFGGLEELGWRGLLLPSLSKIFKFQIAALVVGVIWGLWHLPLFFMSGATQYQSNFIVFAIQVIGLGFVLARLYGRTKSIFICVLFHAFSNAVSSSGLSSPDGNGYVNALIWLVVGLGLVILDRKHLNLNTTLYKNEERERKNEINKDLNARISNCNSHINSMQIGKITANWYQ